MVLIATRCQPPCKARGRASEQCCKTRSSIVPLVPQSQCFKSECIRVAPHELGSFSCSKVGSAPEEQAAAVSREVMMRSSAPPEAFRNGMCGCRAKVRCQQPAVRTAWPPSWPCGQQACCQSGMPGRRRHWCCLPAWQAPAETQRQQQPRTGTARTRLQVLQSCQNFCWQRARQS